MYPKEEIFDVAKRESGILAEAKAYKYLKRFYPRRGRNRKLYFRDFSLSGRPDFILNGSVIEVKKSKLWRIRREWLAQLNLYLLFEKSEEGYLFEVGDNGFRITKYKFNPEIVREALNYFLILERHISRNKIPIKSNSNFCKFCSYSHLCESPYK